MKRYFWPLIVLIMTTSLFVACGNDDEDEPEEPTTTTPATTAEPSSPQPQPTDADAVLIAIQSVSYTTVIGQTIETTIGLPVAIFPDGAGFLDVGAVTCESEALTKQDNNAYVYVPSLTNPTGVSYSGDIDWDIAGANGFPAHTKAADDTFPGNLDLTTAGNSTVSTGSDFTLSTTAAITDADSVYYGVYGPSGQLLVVKAGNTNTHTFSASEMASVGTGTGFVQIAAYRVSESETLTSGEVIYYLNEKVNTTAVTFN